MYNIRDAAFTGLSRARLRRWLLLFFLALFVPALILVSHAYSQLKWEAFHQYNILADELTRRIDDRLARLIQQEESRAFTDYAFINVAGDPAANFLQRSPLSAFPVAGDLPGLLGYFQVDAGGQLSTPLLPGVRSDYQRYGLSDAEWRQRLESQRQIQRILHNNQLLRVGPQVADVAAEKQAETLEERVPPEGQWADEDAAPVDQTVAPAMAQSGASPEPNAQAAFDRLSRKATPLKKSGEADKQGYFGRVDDLKLDSGYQQRAIKQKAREAESQKLQGSKVELAEQKKNVFASNNLGQAEQEARLTPYAGTESIGSKAKRPRKERSVLADAPLAMPQQRADSTLQQADIKIRIFESEIGGFELSLLDSGHFVLYRNAWRGGERLIQGALLDQKALLEAVFAGAFKGTAVSQMSDLIVAYQGDVLGVFSGNSPRNVRSVTQPLNGELLHRARLSQPLSDIELLYNINHLPPGSGQTVIHWVTGVLLLVLVGGFYLFYRLADKQLELVKQQQDFVSAVSHELKTPLTSIRMYGEMLREGWASEDKKKSYYEFIHDESERLSRLIGNVLQLARMTRNELRLELIPKTVSELLDGLRSKLNSQAERAGFELKISSDPVAGSRVVRVDADSFSQVMINLVDNAIKFSGHDDQRCISIAAVCHGKSNVLFTVRDYGPGIPKDQRKKIFQLFYRPRDELTRETTGTGIGLALVRQLVISMKGEVEVRNRQPGAEFRIILPATVQPVDALG